MPLRSAFAHIGTVVVRAPVPYEATPGRDHNADDFHIASFIEKMLTGPVSLILA